MMTKAEYLYLVSHEEVPSDIFHVTGVACYEEGWIDMFGLITPKGRTAIEGYEHSHD